MNNSKFDPNQFENCVIPNGQKLAIIIPFRDDGSNIRTNQLKVLLHYMIPVLIRQNVKFQFFVVTQEFFKSLESGLDWTGRFLVGTCPTVGRLAMAFSKFEMVSDAEFNLQPR